MFVSYANLGAAKELLVAGIRHAERSEASLSLVPRVLLP